MKSYEHYVNDVETMNVAQNAASSFRKILSQDEIKSCILNAILRAVNKYDKRSKAKFTTYLHSGVVFECLSQRKFNRNNNAQLQVNIPDRRDPFVDFETRDLIESVCDDPSLVIDRLYGDMTIKELASTRGVCGETIRIRLNKSLEKIKYALNKSV
jgi:DNA-directed RNA polymerase specialized sigma24 family protein